MIEKFMYGYLNHVYGYDDYTPLGKAFGNKSITYVSNRIIKNNKFIDKCAIGENIINIIENILNYYYSRCKYNSFSKTNINN